MRKSTLMLLSVVIVASMLAACGPVTPAATTVPTQPKPTTPPPPPPTAVPPTATPEPVVVRWFVGLGTGANPEQQEAQAKVVSDFNASHPNIKLEIEVVQNDVAYDRLKTEIASGNPPDIVGPVGVRGANEFTGLFLDMTPYVQKTNYDLSDFDPAAVSFWKFAGEGQVGLPFGFFPSFLYINKDLFDEAGLAYPPAAYGEKYEGKDWDIQAMEDLAMLLTLDANGNDATSPNFDPNNIVQWGFVQQWTDTRGQATLFGAGSFVGPDGKTAVVPDHWRAEMKWYYDGIWKKHFIPTGQAVGSDLLAAGNPFDSGNVAMAYCHLWYTCCLSNVPNWDMAVVPSYNGKVTAKLHADTFRILKATKHPDEAFEVLTYLLGEAAPSLLLTYGGMPARKSAQPAFFEGLAAKYPFVENWDVAVAGLSYPDNPNHESNMPNFAKADDAVKALQSKYENTPDLDMDTEIDAFIANLQAIFNEAP